MSYVLRKMQQDAVDACIDFFQNGKPGKNGIAVCPTAWGKSLLISNVVAALDAPALVFQPSKEILEQNLAKFQAYGFRPSVYSASMGRKTVGDITLVTIGSVAGTSGKKNARASKAHLFQDFPYVVADEADLIGSKSGQYKAFFEELSGVKILGVSVGPESIIEMTGGPFGSGFVGQIEQAFAVALSSGLTIRRYLEKYDIIDLQGACSRGWTGEGFDWKPCNSIIRHCGEGLPMKAITAHGHRLTATEDHSIYRAVPGLERYPRNGRPKYYPRIDCPPSSDLRIKDRLIGDDGANWEYSSESVYDLVEVCRTQIPKTKVRVACDLAEWSVEALSAYATSPRAKPQAQRWKKSGTVPTAAYCAMGDRAPVAKHLLLEGSRATSERFIRLSDWAYVLGFYLGDGWITYEKKQTGSMGFAVEREMVPTVKSALENLNGIKWRVRIASPPKHESGSDELRAANVFVVALLTEVCGRVRCYEKHVPGEWITSWPIAARRQLLQGMIDSDGSYGPTERNKSGRTFTTTSRALADGLMSLLRSIGVTGSLHERKLKPGDGGTVHGRKIVTRLPSYAVVWSGHAQEGDTRGKKGTPQRFIHDDLSFAELPVRAVRDWPSPPFVYDLSMDGHPSFVASGVLVHNTATPWRMSSDSFGTMAKFLTRTRPRIFSEIVWYTQVEEMVQNGYWAKLEYKHVKGFDRHAVKANSTGADFDDRALQLHFFKIGFQDKIVEVVKRLKTQRKNALIFTRFVQEAEYVASQVEGLAVVTADTHKAEREAIGREFREGRLWGIVNCAVYTVGFDYPQLETVVVARPTKSLRLWYQMAGRGVRIHPEKESCWLVDMCDLVSEFGKVEDLKLYCEGESKWAMFGKPGGEEEVQLTNVNLRKDGNRCNRCGSELGFWMRHCETGNKSPLQRPPFGMKPNIRLIRNAEDKTVYEIVGTNHPDSEFINHNAVCRREPASA